VARYPDGRSAREKLHRTRPVWFAASEASLSVAVFLPPVPVRPRPIRVRPAVTTTRPTNPGQAVCRTYVSLLLSGDVARVCYTSCYFCSRARPPAAMIELSGDPPTAAFVDLQPSPLDMMISLVGCAHRTALAEW
jgi:hypothetical protein